MDGLDAEGKRFAVPLSWTDAAEEDPFRLLSRGRSYGHVRELLRLAELLENVR